MQCRWWTEKLEGGLERFHNSHAHAGSVQGGIFLRKMPLDGGGFGVQQLLNRCSRPHEELHDLFSMNSAYCNPSQTIVTSKATPSNW